MIRRVPAYVDSEGVFHPTREDACKAEFHRLIEAHFAEAIEGTDHAGSPAIRVAILVENMFDLDRICGEAQKEDTRVEYAPVQAPEERA